MKLPSLILLVLMIVGGTAASVRWYLQAAPRAEPARALARPASVPTYVTLPMRADPARASRAGWSPGSFGGVASRGSEVPRSDSAIEQPSACSEAAPMGAFAPSDPL